MGINDPVRLVCKPEWDPTPWYLTQGRETFYDDERNMLRWSDWRDAVEYARVVLGVEPLRDEVVEKSKRKEGPRQARLF